MQYTGSFKFISANYTFHFIYHRIKKNLQFQLFIVFIKFRICNINDLKCIPLGIFDGICRSYRIGSKVSDTESTEIHKMPISLQHIVLWIQRSILQLVICMVQRLQELCPDIFLLIQIICNTFWNPALRCITYYTMENILSDPKTAFFFCDD